MPLSCLFGRKDTGELRSPADPTHRAREWPLTETASHGPLTCAVGGERESLTFFTGIPTVYGAMLGYESRGTPRPGAHRAQHPQEHLQRPGPCW